MFGSTLRLKGRLLTAAFVLLAAGTTSAMAQEMVAVGPAIEEAAHGLSALPGIWWVAPIGAILALVFAWMFFRSLMRADEGDPDMIKISGYVRAGALAYLTRQYKVVAIFFVVVSFLLFIMGVGGSFCPRVGGGKFYGLGRVAVTVDAARLRDDGYRSPQRSCPGIPADHAGATSSDDSQG